MSFNPASSPAASVPPEQKPKLPPATPVYVLRGHSPPIHALHFYDSNSRLISGDSEGWVIVWNMATKRPVAAWKAHEGAVLGVQGISFEAAGVEKEGEKRIFTHGRDNSLRVWRLDLKDEEIVDKTLPVDIQTSAKEGNEPWLIHSLTVNALNFCPFALCFIPARKHEESKLSAFPGAGESSSKSLPDSQMLLAVPNALNTGGMDIFHLPSEKRVSVIPPDPSVNTGMVMAVQLFCSRYGDLYVVSGYEDGRAIIHVRRGYMNTESGSHGESRSEWDWELIYMSKPHSQPILSLEVSPEQNNYFLTSSADAIIAKHPIPIPPPPAAQGRGAAPAPESSPIKIANTKHSGQQGLRIRSDEKIFVTAGWDFKTRVYSCKTMKELAVLKWHKEGCYAVALADVSVGFDSDGSLPSTDKPTEGPAKETCPSRALTVSPQLGGSLAEIKLQRSRKAERTHWVAAGSKDGKISLWDIY